MFCASLIKSMLSFTYTNPRVNISGPASICFDCLSSVTVTITIPFSLNDSLSFNTSSPMSPTVFPSIKISSTFTVSFVSFNSPFINVATCPFNFKDYIFFIHSYF